ncbi:MAG: GNAT family N-acetyltransferase [Microthrixaceae bacterium]
MCEGRHEVEVRVLDRLGPTWSASWDHLVDSMELPSPFLRSWWLDAMAASADAPAFVLVLVEDRLLGGIAVQTERRLGVECVELLGSGPLEPDHLDVVVDPADASATALVLDEVGRWLHRPGSRVLDLVGVAPGARLFDIVARGARRRVEVAPFVALPGTHEEYLASRGGRTRGTVARSARRLGRDGSTIRIVRADRDGVDAFDAALMALARLHHTRWGDRSGFLDRWAAFTAAARSGSLRGEVWCCELVGPDQETAAVEVDFVVAGRMSFYQAGRSTDRRWRGGGSWVRSETVRAAISSGCHEFDLLRGAEPYKSEWADRSRGVWALRAGVGPIGRAAVGAAAVRAAARGRASSLLRNVWSAEDRTGPVGDGSVRRPRILFYTDADQIGGAETVARTLLSGLSDRFDVVIVGTDSTVVEHLAEARAVTTMVLDPIVDRSDVAAMAGHRRVIAALAPDVFHANLSEGSSCQYALLAALSVPGVRVVVTENSPMGVRTRLSGSIKRRSARWFDAHVAVGERTARMVEADVGLAPGRVITIPNAVPPIDRRILTTITRTGGCGWSPWRASIPSRDSTSWWTR